MLRRRRSNLGDLGRDGIKTTGTVGWKLQNSSEVFKKTAPYVAADKQSAVCTTSSDIMGTVRTILHFLAFAVLVTTTTCRKAGPWMCRECSYQGAPGMPGLLERPGAKVDQGLPGLPGWPGMPTTPNRQDEWFRHTQSGDDSDTTATKEDDRFIRFIPECETLPRAQGPRGFPGLKGLTGPPGRDGYPGRKGDDGVPGSPCSPCPYGSSGDDEIQGELGPPGLPCRDGLDGLNGRDGLPGSDGSPGLEGLAGLPGIKGQKGEPGGQTKAPGIVFYASKFEMKSSDDSHLDVGSLAVTMTSGKPTLFVKVTHDRYGWRAVG